MKSPRPIFLSLPALWEKIGPHHKLKNRSKIAITEQYIYAMTLNHKCNSRPRIFLDPLFNLTLFSLSFFRVILRLPRRFRSRLRFSGLFDLFPRSNSG